MSHLTTGNAKRFLPIFSPSYIGDFDQEGYENVPSEDFDPGYGCVPVEKPKPVLAPPQITTSAPQQRLTEAEQERHEDEYLAAHGVDISKRGK